MKPEEQRIAIAEACGWTPIGRPEQYDPPIGFPAGALTVAGNQQLLPDYLNDINAMREAENKLSKDHRKQLVYVLLRVVIADLDRYTPEIDKFRVIYFATAAQRAEAFLRTLNLWKP
jgi:hypothetical protein